MADLAANSPVALMINGSRVGDLRAIDGLEMEADVATNDIGPDNVAKKHVSNIRWTPATIALGLGMGDAMWACIHGAFATGSKTTSGSIVLADATYHALSSTTFDNALLTRCTFPILDKSNKAPAWLTVEFTPEQVRINKGDGSDIRGRMPTPRPWLSSGFKVEIGGLPCEHVLRVEPIVWTCAVAADQIGILREPAKHAAVATLSDLTLTISAKDLQLWRDAATSWFVGGNHLEGNELQGLLTYLAADGTALSRIGFKNLGFKKFETLSAVSSTPDQFVVSFYIEAISFDMLV